MNYEEFCDSRVKWFTTPQEDLVHSAMGLLGEIVEYQAAVLPSERIEELGDLEFYFCHAHLIVAKLSEKFPVNPVMIEREEMRIIERDPEYWMMMWCAKYHNFAKKAWVYRKDLAQLTQEFHAALRRIELILFILANKLKTTRDEVKQANRVKLEARYPDGYSDAAAQARMDKLNTGEAFV